MVPEENPLEGVGDEMVPEELKGLMDSPAAAPPSEVQPGEALPEALTPEEVAAHLGAEEPVPPADAPDKGLGATEPILSEEEVATPEVPLPPPEAMRGAPLFTEASLRAPGPEGTGPQSPQFEESPPSPEMVAALVTEERLQNLWERADTLQAQVNAEISSLHLARTLLDLIQQARNQLLSGRDAFEEAERALNEVEYRIHLARRVQQWSYTIGLRLFFYEVLWAVVLSVALLAAPAWVKQLAGWFGYQGGGNTLGLDWLIVGFQSVCWGGLGGVTGALYALWRHIAREQDFDRQYTMWYLTNPIMGLALGAFVHLVIRAGLLSLTTGGQQSLLSAAAVFVLAWISGFQQNVAYDIVRRILRVFRIEEEEGERNRR